MTAATASAFARIDSPNSQRHLLSSTDTIRLPAEPGAATAGTLFLPPCGVPLVCNASDTVTSFVNPLVEKVVFQKCMPLKTITEKTSMVVFPLANANLYRVLTILSDTLRWGSEASATAPPNPAELEQQSVWLFVALIAD